MGLAPPGLRQWVCCSETCTPPTSSPSHTIPSALDPRGHRLWGPDVPLPLPVGTPPPLCVLQTWSWAPTVQFPSSPWLHIISHWGRGSCWAPPQVALGSFRKGRGCRAWPQGVLAWGSSREQLMGWGCSSHTQHRGQGQVTAQDAAGRPSPELATRGAPRTHGAGGAGTGDCQDQEEGGGRPVVSSTGEHVRAAPWPVSALSTAAAASPSPLGPQPPPAPSLSASQLPPAP